MLYVHTLNYEENQRTLIYCNFKFAIIIHQSDNKFYRIWIQNNY